MSPNTMYRSASSNRVMDDFTMHASQKLGTVLRPSPDDENEIPAMEATKKDKPRSKFAENGVHVIPFVLLLCALVLWLFSDPNVEVGIKGETAAAKIEALTVKGDIDNDSDGTQTGFFPGSDLSDSDAANEQGTNLTKRGSGAGSRSSRKLVKGDSAD